jgi:hypothetical protein
VKPGRGYTIRVCLGCFRDRITPTRGKTTPLCDACLESCTLDSPGKIPDPTLPAAPAGVQERSGDAYVPALPTIGKAKRKGVK